MQKKVELTNDQRKIINSSKDVTMNVSIFEEMVITRLRNILYGEITIVIVNGVPQRTDSRTTQHLVPDNFV